MLNQLAEKLKDEDLGTVLLNEPLKNHTTLKIGGPADLYYEPKNIESLKTALSYINEVNVPIRAIGRGSNLLVADGGIEGVVIKVGEGLNHLEKNDNTIRVGGGYSLITLATLMSREAFTGLEFAAGIPGSVGGAVFMNAGAHGSDMSKIVEKALILFPDGELKWLSTEELGFSYRTSILQEKGGICVEAVLVLEKGDKETIMAELKKNKDYRRNTQPWNFPCCGSVFRNPLPNYAGQLIESSGLKGTQIGGAQISEMHANFIVNTGDAEAKDVLELISFIQKTIKEKHGVDLHTEVEIIGRND
ncbi:UDP-N-acetylmuramate dehydrogenase [Fictibacillus barbaricus]|uniref:UDP-N-acetylenolpyruvoylglucosamine reductase n=1 Tax=Fictibacillus barbaricus TaxID=182136 RepID=A0ABS2ZCL3_9BACL|nr:UDP-N-acetylmuramate dehydrogenase [Fictibacillus barbaricus]MBN3545939.1 UDP-N-acetylmuramate dehydrogenase [Fictibacillus barbaricus]GGB57283.1 UDP-N-acetylenolpyruvoylglucosamine reductase [Fictibacillus barbaricus]